MEVTYTAKNNNGIEYTIKPCTAIAASIDDTTRQDALLVTSVLDSGETVEMVVFGYDMPENQEDFDIMCEDMDAWDSYQETLDTVEFASEI